MKTKLTLAIIAAILACLLMLAFNPPTFAAAPYGLTVTITTVAQPAAPETD